MAKHLDTGKIVAIKKVNCDFSSSKHSKLVVREICILRQLTSMANNVFTSHLYDIILPDGDIDSLQHLFLVLEHVDMDLKTLLSQKSRFEDRHLTTIMYNLLCSLNFVHSANVIHRDIKPANLLITPNCTVKICDFGLSRTLP